MRPKLIRAALTLALLGALQGCVGDDQAASPSGSATVVKGGDNRLGDYLPAAGWWKAAPNHDDEWTWGSMAGVTVDNPDRIIATHWGDRNAAGETRPTNLIVVANRNGEITEVWSQWDSIVERPHHVFINPYDPERSVWIVDVGQMAVMKFSNDGKQLLMRIGDRPHQGSTEAARMNPNPGPYQFGSPASMAFFPNGDFLVGDGYGNSRVVRFNAAGEYLYEWGSLGSGPGEFDLVHALAIGPDGRVYVADRTNNRIQVFTSEGEFIEEWPNIMTPFSVYLDANENLWVTNRTLNKVHKFSRDGQFLYEWGGYGGMAGTVPGASRWEGGIARAHGISVDQEGSVYLANFDGAAVTKYTPRPGADPNKIIHPVGATEN